jgi:hypothetical protein
MGEVHITLARGTRPRRCSVGITHERAVIAGVVLRPQPGFVQHLGADAGGCLEERPHGGPVGRRECDMGLAEPSAAGPRADPEFRLARGAEPDDLAEVHHPGSAERAEHGVVERGAGAHVSALNGQVIQHAAIFTPDPYHRVLTPHPARTPVRGVSCRRWPVRDRRNRLGAAGLSFAVWRRRAGPAWADASPADPGRRDAHVHVAGAARPRLEARSVLHALDFTLICDPVRATLHQDAPALDGAPRRGGSTSKLSCALAYSASSVSGAVRKMMAFPVTAKLTGRIMIPFADANPTRPTPPGSSRPKHSAGPSVRSACPGAGGCRPGTALGAPGPLAGPVLFVICVHLRRSRAVSLPQPCRAAVAGAAARRPGWPGRSALGGIRPAGRRERDECRRQVKPDPRRGGSNAAVGLAVPRLVRGILQVFFLIANPPVPDDHRARRPGARTAVSSRRPDRGDRRWPCPAPGFPRPCAQVLAAGTGPGRGPSALGRVVARALCPPSAMTALAVTRW